MKTADEGAFQARSTTKAVAISWLLIFACAMWFSYAIGHMRGERAGIRWTRCLYAGGTLPDDPNGCRGYYP